MWLRATITSVLVVVSFSATADDQMERRDRLLWDYAQFVELFRVKDWPGICELASEHIQVGFGPGDEGCVAVKRVYGENQRCWGDMLFALRQGCRTTQAGGRGTCISPPQFADTDVVYMGARAGFSFDAERGRWMADSLICGGD